MDFIDTDIDHSFGPAYVQQISETNEPQMPWLPSLAHQEGPLDGGRSWDKRIRDFVRRDRLGKTGLFESRKSGATIFAQGLEFSELKYGITFRQTGETLTSGMSFDCVQSDDRFGGAIRLGGSGKPVAGKSYFVNIRADGCEDPEPDYGVRNTDFLATERGNQVTLLRFLSAKNFSDAIIDAKSDVIIANATISDSYRELRAHDGANILIVNSTVSSPDGGTLAWLGGPDASIHYFNVLWDGEPALDPQRVQISGRGATGFERQVVALNEDPLPWLSPLFADTVDSVTIERKTAQGRWIALDRGRFGGDGLPVAGNLRFEVSLDTHQLLRVILEVRPKDGLVASFVSEEFVHVPGRSTVDVLALEFVK